MTSSWSVIRAKMAFVLSVYVTLSVSTTRRRCNEFHNRTFSEGMLTIWKTLF